jgi:hypothetical protein
MEKIGGFLQLLLLTPFNLMAFFVGFALCGLLTFWRRVSIFDFLLVAVINIPTALLAVSTIRDTPIDGAATTVPFGVGGIGVGWITALFFIGISRSRRAIEIQNRKLTRNDA